MDSCIKVAIAEKLVETILDIAPNAKMLTMYGGTMIEMVGGETKSRCCGYFVYANHVSLEFSNGSQFTDPHDVLEGSGKLRRHIKLRKLLDVNDKHCAYYLKQAREVERPSDDQFPSPG